jgi:ERCC4-related helicase
MLIGQQKSYVSHPLLYPDVVEERVYQTKIAQDAYNKNTLVILPTALGKTVISAFVVSQILHDYRNTRVLVLAPTRPLVLQHRSSFQAMLRLPEEQFALLTGKTPADYRTSVWAGSSRLVFATPEVVRNDLREGRFPNLKDFGLLVFDECHRSVKEYAYTEVAGSYVKSCHYPLILGMTASPGSDLDRIAMVCKSLFIEQVEYRSEEDEDVKPYINLVTVEAKTVTLPPEYLPVNEALRGMFNEKIRSLRYKGLLKNKEPTFITKRDLIELGSDLRYQAEMSIEEERGRLWAAISIQSQALTLLHMLELLDTQGAYTLKCFADRLEEDNEKKSHLAIVNDPAYTTLRRTLDDDPASLAEHPKLEEAKRIVSEQVKSNPRSRVLVFAQYRDTTSHLVEELNKVGGVRAERFVGQASKVRDKGLTQDKQASLIEDLRKGYINTLCCTSIAEEGLDIPEVDLVIFYEPIPSEIRYIQRRGRTGRKAPGRVIILAAEGTVDTVYLYASERRIERMKSIISSLNQRLRSVSRLTPRPPKEPMIEPQLKELQSLRPVAPLSSVKAEEYEKVKGFGRIIARAEHDVYMRILQNEAEGFVDEDLLYSEMEEEKGYSREVVSAALQKLVKAKRLAPPRPRTASAEKKLSVAIQDIPGARPMMIEVEKLIEGGAIVIIDDKWHARLEASNYNGPRQLIKKGKKFKALCELYHSSDTLNLNVRQVVQVAS